MASISPLLLLVLFLLSSLLSSSISAILAHAASGPDEAAPMKLVPAASGQRSVLILDEAKRRRLNSFQICSLCTCCGGPRGLCLPSPCCYSINCNIPNRPFGFCSFTPKTCNCFGCHL